MSRLNYISSSIDDKYVINFYSNASNNYTTTFPSSSITQSVTTQNVTQSVFNNYLWTNSTGSDPSEWSIVSGTDAIALLNPNRDSSTSIGYNQIGARVEVRDGEIFTSLFRDSSTEKHNGIAIFKSASSGWYLNGYVNIPTSSGGVTTTASGIGREFSVHGNYLAAAAYEASGNNSRLHIFKSGSTGWDLEQTLTTSSYNDGAVIDTTTGAKVFLSVKIHGSKLVTTGFTRATGGSNQYERYLGIFNSGSTGWIFEDQVFIRDYGDPGGSLDSGGSVGISGLALDFDGTTIVVGSKEGVGSESYHNEAGAIYVITSGSTGWEVRQQLDLLAAGVTTDVSSDFGSNYSSEYRTFKKFGYMGCSVNGNYIVGSAEGQNIYISSLSNYRRQKNAVFIFKSSSSGWGLEKRINDPTSDFLEVGALNDTTETLFGLGVKLKDNSLVINSPNWRSNTSTSDANAEGRAYVYVSSSSTNWPLIQTIESPFSGSSIYNDGSGNNKGFTDNAVNYFSSGEIGYGVNIGLSGSILALGAPRFTRNASDSAIRGAVVILEGTSSFVDQVVEEHITESVTTTTLVTRSGGSVPFRFGTKGAFNIRGQSPNSYYKTFVGDQKN